MGSLPTSSHSGHALSPAQGSRKCQALPHPTPTRAVGRLCLGFWGFSTSPAFAGDLGPTRARMTLDKTFPLFGPQFPPL